MIVYKAYRFRLKTNPSAERSLKQFAGCSRFVWNHFLTEQKVRFDGGEKVERWFALNNRLTALKKTEGASFLCAAPSQVLQQKLRDLSRAFSDFFDKKKSNKMFPRLKKKGLSDSCGTISSKNRINQKRFKCVECGYAENADLVAAQNILAAGHVVIARGEIDTS